MDVLLTKDYILGLLDKKGINKSEFAKQMGYKRQNVDTMLDSKKKDINTIIKIADILDMSLDEFLFGKTKGIQVNGYLKVNGTLVEVKSKDDLVKVLSDIDNIEKNSI